MPTSVRYVGPSPHVDLPTLDIYGQKRLVVFEVEDRDVAVGLLATADFDTPPAKKAKATKTDPAPAGDDAPATSADANQSEED